MDTILPMGVSGHTTHYWSLQGSQLGRVVDDFSPSTASIMPFDVMKVSQQEGFTGLLHA